jgi:flagellar biosynthesis GTPase FlhF
MSMTETVDEKRTFRGRSLEELLPQIREAFGPDAVVLRRREGLTGGVGGFFQRSYVEVEASGPDGAAASAPELAPEPELGARNDRATAEGMASPAIQLLLDQAAPFADQLQAAQRDRSAAEQAADLLGSTALGGAGLYGPQPNVPPAHAPEPAAAEEPEPPPASAPEDAEDEGIRYEAPEPFDEPARPEVAPALELLAPRPAAAVTAERRLTLSGLDSALSADVVGEAVAHGIPFATPRSLKKLVRSALARRIPVMSGRGPGGVALAFVGGTGSGKTTAAGHLAAAYADAGTLSVLVVALRPADGGAALRERLAGTDVAVFVASDGEEARRAIDAAPGAMAIVDTPSFSPRDTAQVAALAADLAALAPDEVHLAVPATVSAAAATELAQALEDVGLTHVALTRTDETEHPGAPVGFCIATRGPLSYLCERDLIAPADPVALAQRLLP